jgi:hypothetical protein
MSKFWSKFKYARKTPLYPSMIETTARYFDDEEALFNHKHDTKSFKRMKQEDQLDMVDNLANTGWAYDD